MRSEFEYSVLRIQGAVNLLMTDVRFPMLA
jgi:hypothetical protein